MKVAWPLILGFIVGYIFAPILFLSSEVLWGKLRKARRFDFIYWLITGLVVLVAIAMLVRLVGIVEHGI